MRNHQKLFPQPENLSWSIVNIKSLMQGNTNQFIYKLHYFLKNHFIHQLARRTQITVQHITSKQYFIMDGFIFIAFSLFCASVFGHPHHGKITKKLRYFNHYY